MFFKSLFPWFCFVALLVSCNGAGFSSSGKPPKRVHHFEKSQDQVKPETVQTSPTSPNQVYPDPETTEIPDAESFCKRDYCSGKVKCSETLAKTSLKQINSAAEFTAMTRLGGSYQLTSDIILPDGFAGFDGATDFFLDGNGYTISNLNLSGGTYRGLFGNISRSIIVGLTLKEPKLSNVNTAGSIAGAIAESTCIDRARILGATISGNVDIGGLVGLMNKSSYLQDSSIESSSVTGIVNIGGLVGSIIDGNNSIKRSKVENVSVTGSGSVGGAIGGVTTDDGMGLLSICSAESCAPIEIEQVTTSAVVSNAVAIGSQTSFGGLIGRLEMVMPGTNRNNGHGINVTSCQANGKLNVSVSLTKGGLIGALSVYNPVVANVAIIHLTGNIGIGGVANGSIGLSDLGESNARLLVLK